MKGFDTSLIKVSPKAYVILDKHKEDKAKCSKLALLSR